MGTCFEFSSVICVSSNRQSTTRVSVSAERCVYSSTVIPHPWSLRHLCKLDRDEIAGESRSGQGASLEKRGRRGARCPLPSSTCIIPEVVLHDLLFPWPSDVCPLSRNQSKVGSAIPVDSKRQPSACASESRTYISIIGRFKTCVCGLAGGL